MSAIDRIKTLAAKIVKFPNAGTGKPITLKQLKDADGSPSGRMKLRLPDAIPGCIQEVPNMVRGEWKGYKLKIVKAPAGLYKKGPAYISAPGDFITREPAKMGKANVMTQQAVNKIEDAYFPLNLDSDPTSSKNLFYVPVKALVGTALLITQFKQPTEFPRLKPAQIQKCITQAIAIIKRETPKGKYDMDDPWIENGADETYENVADVVKREMGFTDPDAIGPSIHNAFHSYMDKKVFLPALRQSKVDKRWFDIDDFEGAVVKTNASSRLLTAGRYVGTQEWFLGMPEEKQKDYLSKKPYSTFKPVHKTVKETNADGSKKSQNKLRKRAEKHLDNKTGLSAAVARLQSLAAHDLLTDMKNHYGNMSVGPIQFQVYEHQGVISIEWDLTFRRNTRVSAFKQYKTHIEKANDTLNDVADQFENSTKYSIKQLKLYTLKDAENGDSMAEQNEGSAYSEYEQSFGGFIKLK